MGIPTTRSSWRNDVAHPDDVLSELVRERGRALTAYARLFTGTWPPRRTFSTTPSCKVFGRMRSGFAPEVAEAYVRSAIASLYVDSFRRRRRWRDREHLLAVDLPATDRRGCAARPPRGADDARSPGARVRGSSLLWT